MLTIKTLDINGKEWFDKVNGNSYHSAQATINYGTPEAVTVYIPFQYGYGSQYEYSAFKALQEAGYIPKQDSMVSGWRYYEENGIIARQNIERKCKKRDVIAWGSKG